MRFLRVVYLLLVAGCCFAPASVSPPTDHDTAEELILTASSTAIREMDPLWLKVAFKNCADHPVPFPAVLFKIRHGYSMAKLEIRRDGGAYQAYRGRYVALSTDDVDPAAPGLAPSGRLVDYDFLSEGAAGPVFAKAGTYELRVTATIEGRNVTSKLVTVRVTAIPEAERVVVERILKNGLPADRAERAEIERQLTDSALKRGLRRTLALQAIKEAEPGQDRKRALAVFEDLRKEMDPVSSEVMDLHLARQLKEMKEWEEASKVLERIKEPSQEGDGLRWSIRAGWKADKELKAFFPADKRLDFNVLKFDSEFANLSALLEHLSQQSKVPLDAPAKIKQSKPRGDWLVDLRRYMVWLTHVYKARWEPKGDGYILILSEDGGGGAPE